MSITVNLYYTGEKGNARKFAEEMTKTGTVEAIRKEEGNLPQFIVVKDSAHYSGAVKLSTIKFK